MLKIEIEFLLFKFASIFFISSKFVLQLPERVYCADVVYPMAAVGLASKKIFIYNLEGGPQFVKEIESQLKYQVAYYSR